MKKPKKTYLVNENELETIDYSEPQEDIFVGESILNAANKVLDFKKFKPEQERQIQDYNENLLNHAETINYVDDIDINDLKENKNLIIAAKKIQDRYRKIRQKRKAPVPIEILHKSSEIFAPADNKKNKKVKDKRALIAARKISKKYKNLYAEFKKAKNIFNKLKIDPSSVAFAEEILDKKLLASQNMLRTKTFLNL